MHLVTAAASMLRCLRVCVTVSGLELYYSTGDDPNAPSTHHLMVLAELGQHGPYVVLL